MKRSFILALLLVLTATVATHAQRCGVERGPVKTGTGGDVSMIDLDHPQTVTINDLHQIHGGRAFARSTLLKAANNSN